MKLFSSDLEGMKLGDDGFEDKMHQLMEVCSMGGGAQKPGRAQSAGFRAMQQGTG